MASSLRAGTITTVMSLSNMVVGFIVQALLAALLGVSALGDEFQTTWTIVTFGAIIFMSMVTSYLVPHMHAPGERRVRLSGTWVVVAAGLLLSGAQTCIALSVDSHTALGQMLMFSAPSIFLASVASIPQVVAYIQRRFALASVGGVANGVGVLLVLLAINAHPTPSVLGLSLTVGYAAQLIVVSIPLLWNRPSLQRGRAVTLLSFAGVVGFTLASKAQPVVERVLSLGISVGSASALGYGQKVAQGILLVASYGLAVTATAALTQHVRADDSKKAGALLAKVIGSTAVICAGAVAGAIPLVYPACVVLFERGAFDAQATAYVTAIVLIQLPWVVASAIAGALTAYLYVRRAYARVLVASMLGIAGTIVGTFAMKLVAPDYAVACGSTLGAVASLAWSWHLVLQSPVSEEVTLRLREMRPMLVSACGLILSSAAAYTIARLLVPIDSWVCVVLPLTVCGVVAGSLLSLPGFRTQIRSTLFAAV